MLSRKVVGWSKNGTRKTHLVVNAVRMAVHNRGAVAGVVHHSDCGGNERALPWSANSDCRGIRASMGCVADCYDNVLAESFFATLETELFDRTQFETHRQVRMAIFDYLEAFYDRKRPHSSLGYLSRGWSTNPVSTRSGQVHMPPELPLQRGGGGVRLRRRRRRNRRRP